MGEMRFCRRIGEHFTKVAVANSWCPGAPLAIPGSYYRIRVPQLSPLEWHPFSLATSDVATKMEFIIKDLGYWTRKLGQFVGRLEVKVEVRGPIIAPASEALEHKRPLLIASGIGITPFLSILHRLVYHRIAQNAENECNK